MLSTVAERIYWLSRYLERVENTARLVSVYANLMLDLPRGVNLGWYNLVVLNGSTQQFEERYKNRDERNVVKFLLADDNNFSSMLSSLRAVRENVRTSRDVVPIETWEQVNELYLFAKDHIQQGINRGQRHEFLDAIVRGCEQIGGLLGGNMSQDAAWEFLRLGRNIERADMTSRILDAGASALLDTPADSSPNLRQIVWGNVLSSLSAYLPYRRRMRTSVRGEAVAEFLLEDPYFPRSVRFCLEHMHKAAENLPRNTVVLSTLEQWQKRAFTGVDYADLGEAFREYLNDLQVDIGALHGVIADAWFSLDLAKQTQA